MKNFPFIVSALPLVFMSGNILAAQSGFSVNFGDVEDPSSLVPAMKIVGMLTVLSVAPAILLMMTSFTRIMVVMSFLRQAIGSTTMPPNQVIVGLSLFLTLFTMMPVLKPIEERVLTPYLEKAISTDQAMSEASKPIKSFMMAETREADLGLFFHLSKTEKPKSHDEVPLSLLIPAFMISELKTAFQIGFLIYIPFLIIDMIVSAVLMAMGMMMLPPTVVSLPFKLVLFVLVDGWTLIVSSLVRSFRTFM